MQMQLQEFIEKVHKSQDIASLHVAFPCRMQVFRIAVRNTEWAEKKIKTVSYVSYDRGEVYVRQ